MVPVPSSSSVDGAATITGDTFGGTAAGDPNTSSGFDPAALFVDSANHDVVITDSTFTDNTVSSGSGASPGGAVFVYVGSHSVTFSNNTLTGNSQTTAGGDGGGADLLAQTLTSTATPSSATAWDRVDPATSATSAAAWPSSGRAPPPR